MHQRVVRVKATRTYVGGITVVGAHLGKVVSLSISAQSAINVGMGHIFAGRQAEVITIFRTKITEKGEETEVLEVAGMIILIITTVSITASQAKVTKRTIILITINGSCVSM